MKNLLGAVLLIVAVATSPAAAQAACDRACLLKTADDYLAALTAHDVPSSDGTEDDHDSQTGRNDQ